MIKIGIVVGVACAVIPYGKRYGFKIKVHYKLDGGQDHVYHPRMV